MCVSHIGISHRKCNFCLRVIAICRKKLVGPFVFVVNGALRGICSVYMHTTRWTEKTAKLQFNKS